MANATVLSSGMGLGFPAITLEALKDDNNPLKLNDEQASWFGEWLFAFNLVEFKKRRIIVNI